MKSLLAEYKHRCPCVMASEESKQASLSLYIYGRKKAELLCCNKDVRAQSGTICDTKYFPPRI